MMKTIRLNDYDFNYEEKGSGQTVILVHGSASDLRIWHPQMETLSRSFHVFIYSRRFHWPNEKIKEQNDYSMEQHMADLRAFIRHTGERQVDLVGHSYGGLMGLELACSNPELIRKLVLAEPPAIRLFVSNTPRPGELLKLLLSRPRTALSVINLGARGLGPATAAAKKGEMEKVMQLFGKAALGKAVFEKMNEERKHRILVNLVKQEFTGSGYLPIPVERLKTCTIPTLLLTGENSPPVFSRLADRLEEIIPVIRREIIPRASHIMQEDNPEAFNSVVLSFLKHHPV